MYDLFKLRFRSVDNGDVLSLLFLFIESFFLLKFPFCVYF